MALNRLNPGKVAGGVIMDAGIKAVRRSYSAEFFLKGHCLLPGEKKCLGIWVRINEV